MNTPLNSNASPSGHLTPSGISRVFSNFHTLVFAPLCNSLIPNNLFTLSKNKGVYPPKGEAQAKLRRLCELCDLCGGFSFLRTGQL